MRTLSDVFARSRVHLLLGAAIAATIPCTALAQSASIEEIIVTAQKREERLQDVPIAISAVTVEQIEARGIDNVLDLRTLAPNLMVSKYPNSNVVSQIAIRGGVTVNAAMYWEPSTAMYLDGVY
ncbi:MAG: TonB-dependent receptor plug domain-containing protein, partial [Pseudomonadales bacterium]